MKKRAGFLQTFLPVVSARPATGEPEVPHTAAINTVSLKSRTFHTFDTAIRKYPRSGKWISLGVGDILLWKTRQARQEGTGHLPHAAC